MQRRKVSSKKNNQGFQSKKDSKSKRVNFDNTRKGKFIKDIEKDISKEMRDKSFTGNDISWYSRNLELLKSAGTIGFSQTTGLADGNNITVPGVMVIPWTTSLGGTNNVAINQAMNDIYSYVVHANSRNTSYNANDLMMLILAGKEVFNGIANLIRIYGLMLKYEGSNVYTPQALLAGCGVNYNSALQSYHKMLFDINNVIAESRQIWLPNDLPVVQREFWLSSNVYMDANNSKSQYYMFTPATLKYYNETYSETGSALIPYSGWEMPIRAASSTMTWDNMVSAVRYLIRQLVNSEDRGLIFGDILKAYGEDAIFRVNYIDQSYTLEYVYSPEVLTQIENLKGIIMPADVRNANNVVPIFVNDVETQRISESPNYAYFDATGVPTNLFQNTFSTFPETATINFHFQGQPSPEEVMIATRLTAVGNRFFRKSPSGSSDTYVAALIPKYCGTEFVIGMYIITGVEPLNNLGFAAEPIATQIQTGTATTSALCALSNFDWAPWMTMYNKSTTAAQYTPEYYIPKNYLADVDNYIVVDQAVMDRLHRTAILSEFGVPKLK